MFTVIESQDDITSLVTLSEAKAQCRLMDSFVMDDTYIEGLISLCGSLAQTYTHRLLSPGVIQLENDDYMSKFILPWGNVSSINSVFIDDVETEDYSFSSTTGTIKVTSGYENIKVNYNAGYSELPVKVKQGILMLISTMYVNRVDFVTGVSVNNLPVQSTVLLDSVRDYCV